MLDARLYWDSAAAGSPLEGGAEAGIEAIDVAGMPEAERALSKLGLGRADLPALALCDERGKIRVLGLRLHAEEIRTLAAGHGVRAAEVTMYATSWCGDCRNALRVLREAAVPCREIDIDVDSAAEAVIFAHSGGRRVVPTLSFDGRIWAFNPSPPLLHRLIEGSGIGG
ncbi:MAG TPA: glutaredoxin family protein [Thermoanaerobaculia bacterium]|nr:glutaredoxin family protein [Thermoanaerobaculia bacterium]